MKQCDFSFFLPFFFIYCISILYGLLVLLFVFPLIGIANAKIYYTGENLFTFDSLPFNADPESPSGNLDVYPISRSHSFGINVTF